MDKRSVLTKLIIAFLVLMFFGGIAFGAVNVLSAEGQEPPTEEYLAGLKPMPGNKEEVIQYLNSCVDFAKSEKAKLEIKTSLHVEDGSIVFGDNSSLLVKSLQYAKESILDNVSKRYPAVSIDFGKDFSGRLWNLRFNDAQIVRTESKEEKDNYTFKIIFPAENNPFELRNTVNDSFHMQEAKDMLAYMQNSYKGFADISHADVKCSTLEINAEVNSLSGKISSITYKKKFTVKADVKFQGKLSSLGEKRLSFEIEENTEFKFTWASILLEPHTLQMAKGESKVVDAVVTASENIPVEWKSSAPEIASVDSKGYVKGHAVSDKPVIITGQFRFLGKTYSDTCKVYVTVPVKKVKISDKKLSLTTGETKTLTASVKPDNATIKGVIWKSEKPAIAAVDKSGKVTAVSQGQTNVYALSEDGYYRISCLVTVTG